MFLFEALIAQRARAVLEDAAVHFSAATAAGSPTS